jgi:hypothetical protein
VGHRGDRRFGAVLRRADRSHGSALRRHRAQRPDGDRLPGDRGDDPGTADPRRRGGLAGQLPCWRSAHSAAPSRWLRCYDGPTRSRHRNLWMFDQNAYAVRQHLYRDAGRWCRDG